MKIIVNLLLAVLFALSLDSILFALPGSGAERLKLADPAFAQAEDRLRGIWRVLSPELKSQLESFQAELAKTGRGQEEPRPMGQGASFAEALTKGTNARSDYLLAKGGQNTPAPGAKNSRSQRPARAKNQKVTDETEDIDKNLDIIISEAQPDLSIQEQGGGQEERRAPAPNSASPETRRRTGANRKAAVEAEDVEICLDALIESGPNN